jgi:hypothetical protein
VRELSLHLLDIAENSIAAHSANISILVDEDSRTDTLTMVVADDGVGMTEETAAKVVDAFYTSRTTRKVGLGLPLLKLAAEECNGYLQVDSKIGKGTRITVQFQRSHIDRMPLGDLAATFLSLLIMNPEIHWVFKYSVDNQVFYFDDIQLKATLQDIPFTEPDVLSYLRETFQSGVNNLRSSGSD